MEKQIEWKRHYACIVAAPAVGEKAKSKTEQWRNQVCNPIYCQVGGTRGRHLVINFIEKFAIQESLKFYIKLLKEFEIGMKTIMGLVCLTNAVNQAAKKEKLGWF